MENAGWNFHPLSHLPDHCHFIVQHFPAVFAWIFPGFSLQNLWLFRHQFPTISNNSGKMCRKIPRVTSTGCSVDAPRSTSETSAKGPPILCHRWQQFVCLELENSPMSLTRTLYRCFPSDKLYYPGPSRTYFFISTDLFCNFPQSNVFHLFSSLELFY